MSKIIVQRDTEWANKARPVSIIMDGQRLGRIEDRQTIAFEIPEGEHEFSMKMDWCTSNKIQLNLEKEDMVHLRVEGFVFSKYFFPVAMIILLIYIGVYLTTGVNSVWLASLVMFSLGYLLFFLTIGRKYYLQLKIK